MGLLGELFPGIPELGGKVMPSWSNTEEPWSILSQSETGIGGQITKLADSDDGIMIHPSAKIGDYVRIEGPCYIGANAEIRHSAYLRKGSWIGEGALVGHSSEIKNSVLLPGSKAPHFNYVGDSILGFGVNLGAGVKLSNVRNDGRDVIVRMVDGERIETGLRKLGALIGDYSQLGCNVVTNPGAILTPSSMVSPNETVTGWFETKS
ncbi:MAG: UDP-N-acetylglucosamine pyrophosphorylase [Methanobacteriota archaeon]|jgi:NDP-sugar pyrophosphorylase family protein|nr:MAG: UDP-N-acetylglucosamine pyrophosphorylase [Euryarchaeota archaeon]